MLKRIIGFLILIPVVIFVVAFAIANRHEVTTSFDPFTRVADVAEPPLLAFTWPLWILLFTVLVLGVVIGGIAGWAGQSRYRRRAREKSREARWWHRRADEEHERAEELREARAREHDDVPAYREPEMAQVRRRRPLPALAAPAR